MRILIVGCGSIGERHLRVFKQLGVTAIPCEPRAERLSEISQRYGCEEGYRSLDEANLSTFDGAVICTAPSSHIDLARRIVEAGLDVLIEKPLSNLLTDVESFIEFAAARGRVAAVGYVLRFHPGIEAVKSLLDEGAIGEILCARLKAGTNFAKGRPDYRRTYFAQVETGGGIILDGSHEIDYLLWFLQDEAVEVSCMYGRLGRMEIETEDTAELLLRFRRGALANVHVNYIQRQYSRYCELIGASGTIRWEYETGQVEIFREETGSWQVSRHPFERDDLFRKQAANFLGAIRGEEGVRVPVRDGLRVLQICLAAKRAGLEGRVMRLGEGE